MLNQQDVHLNGRTVTLDGLALEVMRTMDEQHAIETKIAFDRGYQGGRAWGDDKRAELIAALRDAERFMEYFTGDTRNSFVGPGTPRTCLEKIRAALNKTE